MDTHDQLITDIKNLSKRITIQEAADAFLYSIASGNLKYRTILSSYICAQSIPEHPYQGKNETCDICGNHVWGGGEDIASAEYIYTDMIQYEKPDTEEFIEEGKIILQKIACLSQFHGGKAMSFAKIIRQAEILQGSVKELYKMLGVLSIAGVMETKQHKGFQNIYTDGSKRGFENEIDLFYPLNFWSGRDGFRVDWMMELFSIEETESAPVMTMEEVNKKLKPATRKSKAETFFMEEKDVLKLTERERIYLGLEPMNPEYEVEYFYSVTNLLRKKVAVFYQGERIRKVIAQYYKVIKDHEKIGWNYSEWDMDLLTLDRKVIPGKNKNKRDIAVNPTNISGFEGQGYAFNCNYFVDRGSYASILNIDGCEEPGTWTDKACSDITCEVDFHHFMDTFIKSCGNRYLEDLEQLKKTRNPKKKVRPGDIFRMRHDSHQFSYGIVIGVIRDLEKWKDMPPGHSYRGRMQQPVIVRLYELLTEDSEITLEELRQIPLGYPSICADNQLHYGNFPIVLHKELEEQDIVFPLVYLKETTVKDDIKLHGVYIEWGLGAITIEKASETLLDYIDRYPDSNRGVRMGIPTDPFEQDTMYDTEVMKLAGLSDYLDFDTFSNNFQGMTRLEYINRVRSNQ